jgi:hypothetical protein
MAHPNSGEPFVYEGTAAGNGGQAVVAPRRLYVKDKRGRATFARSAVFRNLDAALMLRVSFDDGTAFLTVKPGEQLPIYSVFNSFVVKSSAPMDWEVTLLVA